MKDTNIYIDNPSVEDSPAFFAPWHVRFGCGEISPRRMALLKSIDLTGSISQAAKQAGMTYKAAWDAVEMMNNMAGESLVERQHGGAGGGGAHLSAKGKKLLQTHARLQDMQHIWMATVQDIDTDILPMMRRLTLRTSARNAFYGRILSIKDDGVEAQVCIGLQGANTLLTTVTRPSIERLRLNVGGSAWALIKSVWVVLVPMDHASRISADNCLCGVVKSIQQDGDVSCEVVLQLEGANTITSVITQQSAESLALVIGCPLCALIQSSHIILGTDHSS